jgi:hypothetical protein
MTYVHDLKLNVFNDIKSLLVMSQSLYSRQRHTGNVI